MNVTSFMLWHPIIVLGMVVGSALVAMTWALLAADEYADRLAAVHEQAHAWQILTRPALFDWAVECPELLADPRP